MLLLVSLFGGGGSAWAEEVTVKWDYNCVTEKSSADQTLTASGLDLNVVNNNGGSSDYVNNNANEFLHWNGQSSATIRYAKFTAPHAGIVTVEYKSNADNATDRIVAVGKSVVTGNNVATLNSNPNVYKAGYTNGYTVKTIRTNVDKGDVYIYNASGGCNIKSITYTYTTSVEYKADDFDANTLCSYNEKYFSLTHSNAKVTANFSEATAAGGSPTFTKAFLPGGSSNSESACYTLTPKVNAERIVVYYTLTDGSFSSKDQSKSGSLKYKIGSGAEQTEESVAGSNTDAYVATIQPDGGIDANTVVKIYSSAYRLAIFSVVVFPDGEPSISESYTITYEMNGHGDQIAQVASATNLPNPLPIPSASGWEFGGWYTNIGLTSAAVAGAALSENTTLYAKWTVEAVDPAHIDDWDQTYSNQTNGKKGFTAEPTFVDGKVVFAPNVRYSKFVINSRINNYYEGTTTDKTHGFGVFDGDGRLSSASGDNPKNPKKVIHYVPGFVAEGILEAVDYYRDWNETGAHASFFDDVKPWFYAVQNWANAYNMSDGTKAGEELDGMSSVKIYSLLRKFAINGTFPNGTTTTFNDGNTTKSNINNSNANTASTAKDRFDLANKALDTYNTNRVITSGNAAGGWWHKASYDNEMWCDGQYMGPATLAHIINDGTLYSQVNDEVGKNDWDLITKQFDISWNYLWNKTDKLLYHGFSTEPGSGSGQDSWATKPCDYDNTASTNSAYWARGNGWYVLALVDVLQQMDRTSQKGGANYNNLKTKLNTLVDGIVARQDATSGVWYQVINKKTELANNYLESSASAIFLTAIMRAQRLGYLTTDYTTQIKNGYKGFVNNFLVSDNEGGINIINCSCSASLKADTGTEAYYATTSGDPRPATDYTEGKALGAFIMAAVEYERLYLAATPTHLVKVTPSGSTVTVMAGDEDITATAKDGTGAQVEEGTQVVVTATAQDGYTFRSWQLNNGSQSGTATVADYDHKYTVASLTSDFDVTVKQTATSLVAPKATTGSPYFTMIVTSNSELNVEAQKSSYDMVNYATITGGNVTVYNNVANVQNMIYQTMVNLNGSGASYVKVDLLDGNEIKTVAIDDVITFTGIGTVKIGTTTSAGTITLAAGESYTVQEGDAIIGKGTIYFHKDGSAQISSLVFSRPSAEKQDITRLSEKGGNSATAKTIYVGQEVVPYILISPFTVSSAALSNSDFTVESTNSSVVSAVIRDASFNNDIEQGDCRHLRLTVTGNAVGTEKITLTFNGNSEYKSKTADIFYTVVAKRTVTFNGGDGATDVPGVKYCGDGLTITAPEAGSMKKTGYEFVGWNTAADGSGTSYAPGDILTITADMTLFAQWKQVGEQVIYHYTVTASQSAVTDDEAIGGTFSSTKAAQPDGSIKVDFNSQSSKNIKFSLNKAIAAGDVIKITMHQGGSSSAGENVYGFGVSSTVNQTPEALLWIPTGSGQNAQVISYKVPEESPLIGKNTLYLHRLNGTSLYFHEIEITRVAAGGTDATIKNVRMNNHNIPETVVDEKPTFAYSIGDLNQNDGKLDVYVTPNDNAANIAIKDASGNAVAFADDKFTASVGQNYTATVTATNGTTTQDYAINVGMAIDRPAAGDGKYKVENILYYEGQKMSATGVDAWISLSAGTDQQLSFPTTVQSNGGYGYRIVNTLGENPAYNNTTGVPTSGAYYKFTPTQAGMLTVAVQLNANKQLIISNGAKIFVPGVDYQYTLKSMDDGSAVSLDNSGKASVNAVGTVTFSVSAKDYYIYAATSKLSLMGFELNTTVPKYTVTANTTTGGSVSINSGAIASGSKVDAGTPLTIVATPATNYKFTGWTNADGEVISTQSTYTVDALNADVNITAQFAATGIVTATATFPLDVMKGFGNSAGDSFTNYDTGNAATANVTLSTSSNNVQGQNSSDGTKVRPNGTFTITPAAGRTIKSIVIHSNSKSSGRVLTSDPADDPTADGYNYTYTFNADGSVTFINNNSSGNVYVTAIDVVYEYHAGDEKVQYLGSFPANSSINDYIGAEYAMPKLTVTNNGAVITEGFTVTYKSNDESVATVEEGTNKITLVGAGSTSIVATITPTGDNANILGSTATISVTSKALEALEVTMNDVTIATTDADYEIPTPVVKVGNATLAANEYTLSYVEKTDASDIVTVNGPQVTLNGSSAKWTVGQATLSVTVTPTATAKEKYHCVASATDDFMITVEGNKLQPYIDMIPEIDMSVNSSIDLVSNVIYGGEPINEYFNFSYALTGSAASKNSSTTNTVKITSGASAGDVTLKITATPKTDFENVYLPTEYSVTIHVKELNKFTSVTVSPTSISMNVGETKPSPVITVVDDEGNTLDEDEYSVLWSSNATSFATVNPSTGVITGIADGTATLTVVVSKDGYESVSKTVTVTVTDPSAFKVVGDTPYAHGTLLSNSEGTMAVALGGWIFSGKPDVSDYGCGNNDLTKAAWGSATGVGTDARTKVTGYDKYLKYGNDNARNENGNNAQPESNALYNGTMEKQSKTTIDPMFNVPCAGSYLEFNPKTNGSLTVVISQNGVFDCQIKKSSNKITSIGKVYRPQRRVFVLDEMGNLVQSTPKLLNGAGKFEPIPKVADYKEGETDPFKPSGDKIKDFTTYTWDLVKTAGAETPCSQAMMLEHYGIENFSSDDATFQNGIYEWKGDNTLFENQAVVHGADFPGAKGWSVLVPAPVSYTFDVKAGKTYYLYNYGSKISFYGFNFDEAKDVIVDNVILSQENAQPVNTQIGHVATVSIDRPVKNKIWNAMVLPFSLNKQQVDAIFGDTYDKNHPDGTQIVYFEDVDFEANKINFTRHAYNTLVAGKPFLIKPHRTDIADDATFTVNTANAAAFPYVTIENTQPAVWGRDKNKGTDNNASFKWKSFYSPNQMPYGSYYIGGSDGIVKHYVPASGTSTTSTVKGFRGYLLPLNNEAQLRAKVFSVNVGGLGEDDDNAATGLEYIYMDENGVMEPISDGKIFNLNGAVVGTSAKDLNTLPAGVYILNGKKYYVK